MLNEPFEALLIRLIQRLKEIENRLELEKDDQWEERIAFGFYVVVLVPSLIRYKGNYYHVLYNYPVCKLATGCRCLNCKVSPDIKYDGVKRIRRGELSQNDTDYVLLSPTRLGY